MSSDDEESNVSNNMSEDYDNGLEEYYQSNREECVIENTASSKEYLYPGLSLLSTSDVDECADEFDDVVVNCCTYQVNTSGDKPFLQFILRKHDLTHPVCPDLLTFPSFKRRYGESVLDMCELMQQVSCISYSINPNNCEYKGFINNRNVFYLFYELKEDSINVHDLCRKNDLWLVLVDEIINHNSCCNFKIDETVSTFFSYYINFACLKDSEDNYIETPSVGYTGVKSKEINLISCFGVPKTKEPNLNEKYFYFTDYQNAIRLGGWPEDKNNRGGIIRFALFLGDMNASINDTEIDEENCDSIYIGNGENSPLWALKRYEQQIPLTCHYIDNLNLSETWNTSSVYYIY
ncbi:MAG: hypothetical protein EBY20_00115 [Alphaproteobacteria bacterium]|uniref:Uncharacterized protein n=1 Tax=viral metagenome TaxID=1070528 RepID=A0A6C0HQF4_9ZZZZ|nr:hypothetical protein [Alphaproteobacteria bacterium]